MVGEKSGFAREEIKWNPSKSLAQFAVSHLHFVESLAVSTTPHMCCAKPVGMWEPLRISPRSHSRDLSKILVPRVLLMLGTLLSWIKDETSHELLLG